MSKHYKAAKDDFILATLAASTTAGANIWAQSSSSSLPLFNVLAIIGTTVFAGVTVCKLSQGMLHLAQHIKPVETAAPQAADTSAAQKPTIPTP